MQRRQAAERAHTIARQDIGKFVFVLRQLRAFSLRMPEMDHASRECAALIYGPTTWTLFVPAWAVVSAFALFPSVAAFRQVRAVRRRRRRARFGCCPACGYDLRATPQRCPECGTTVNATGAMS